MSVEEAPWMASERGKLQSQMWIVDGVLIIVAFTLAGFLCAWLASSGEEGRRVSIAVEISLFLLIGAVALGRLRMVSGRRAETKASFGTTRVIVDNVAACPGLDIAVKAVLSHARSYTRSELAALVLLGAKGGPAEVVTLLGEGVRTDTVRFDSGASAPHHRVFTEEKSVLVNDCGRYPTADLPVYYPALRNFLGVPVRINGAVRGQVLVANKPSPFGSEDEACLAILSGFIGPIIVNHQLMQQVREGYMGTVEALVKAIEAKDPFTGGHSERVTKYAMAIAREMGFTPEQIEEVRVGAVLHDVGKIGVPEAIINKAGGLSDDEWAVIKDHPRVGAEILDPFNTSKDVLAMVYHHHERFDGKGYPAGLKGDAIPLTARILKVADSFEAMTSGRAYRSAKTRTEAVEELKRCSGTDFDPAVVSALLSALAREWQPTAEEKLARAMTLPRASRVQ